LAKATIKTVVSEWKRAVHVSPHFRGWVRGAFTDVLISIAYPGTRTPERGGGGTEEGPRAFGVAPQPVWSTSILAEGSLTPKGSLKWREQYVGALGYLG
jgi:hypothetical protein